MVVFGQKLLYLGKVVLVWGKVVVFLESGSIFAKWLYSGKSGCIRAK